MIKTNFDKMKDLHQPKLTKKYIAQKKKCANLHDKIEYEVIAKRKHTLDRNFEWSEENLSKLKDLDAFLKEKQKLLYDKVSEALEIAKKTLANNPDYLGGEVEIKGRLIIENPYDQNQILPGIDEETFSIMVERANHWAFEINCSSYRPIDKDSENYCFQSFNFPEFNKKFDACYQLAFLNMSNTFSISDILALDRKLFDIEITISNFF